MRLRWLVLAGLVGWSAASRGDAAEDARAGYGGVEVSEPSRVCAVRLQDGVLEHVPRVDVEPVATALADAKKEAGTAAAKPTSNVVALTFDIEHCGTPEAELILDALDEDKSRATFFVTGNYAKSNPDLIKRMSDEGHEVGNHTYDHRNLLTLKTAKVFSEIKMGEEAISQAGVTSRYFRPPYGNSNGEVSRIALELGEPLVKWTLDSRDWAHSEPDWLTLRVPKRTRNADVVLFHDKKITAESLPAILKGLRARGFVCATLSELFRANLPAPGRLDLY